MILGIGLLSFLLGFQAGDGRTLTAAPEGWLVERADAWEALFNRTSGWTGADGIYSIPISGDESPGSAAETSTLFVFSDTFIGEVGSDGQRLAGSTLVNNTLVLLKGGEPVPGNIEFRWPSGGTGNPKAVFEPATPNTNPGDWYWLMDGIALDGWMHIFALRMKRGDGGVFNFAVAGVALLSAPLDSPAPWQDQVQLDTPLHFVPTDGRGEIIFGAGIMANTAEAGAPDPDGYIYTYGTQNDPFVKKLVAARVLPNEFQDFSKWRYWDGTIWSTDIETAATLANRVSSELSVSPLTDGRVVLVFQLDTLGRDVAVRIGESPVGPFGDVVTLWSCPEPDTDPDIYCYNAKAHPNLSQPGELLISYNVNTFDFFDHFTNADIYRPRFINVRRAPGS